MTIYLLKFSACLAILILFYKIFLEKENFHVFKRFYLISAVISSIVIPLITFTTYIEPVTYINQPISNLIITNEKTFNFIPLIIFCVYGVGLILFGYKFIRNLFQIGNRIKRNTKIKTEDFTGVLLKEPVVPHTFFSFIFFNKNKFEKQLIPEEVILHERTHAKQKHSLDVLFIELFQVVLWFNPLIYIIKHSIKLNHEFLADEAVLKNGTSLSNYQKILLTFSSNANHSPLTNAINYSFIKKRFTVMKTHTSKKSFWIKCLLILPLVSLLLFSFSSQEEVEKENTLIESITIQEDATKKQIVEYNTLAKKYNFQNGERIIIKKKELERLNYLYDLMSKSQKKSAEPFPNFPPPPPSPKVIKGLNDTDSSIPPPPAPKVIKGVNDTDSSIPPPPPIPNMKDLAKQGATFYYNGKKISSEKANQLYKKNKKLNVQVSKTNTRNPVVKLSEKPIQLKKSSASSPTSNQTSSLQTTDSTSEFVTLSKDGARFFLFDGGPHFKEKGMEVTLEKALEILKNVNGLTINIKDDYIYTIVELRMEGC
ncbi:MAG: hypothetical protein ACI9SJ_001801 [Flavobacteriaceae bacterium]|jgi:hypothetical protein|uniref:M56 family metallopeptidase n=1 Tax=Candidatus Marifrigoribacter sp. Uisw_064 TaxID=3230970 RepID=UPI003AEF0589